MVKGSYAEDQGAIAAIQVLEQQYQQNTRGRTGRPHRPVEHLMVAGEVAVIAATHDPQRRGHRALAWRQYRAHQQHLRFAPGWVAEQRCEGNENGYNGIGQGEHGWTFRRKWGQAILPCPYSFPKKCAKSSKGYVDRVVISCGTEVIAKHPRSYVQDDFVFDPIHYLPLLERKTGALDQAAPLAGWDLPEEYRTLRRLLEDRMGQRGKREFVRVLRLMEHFSHQEVHHAVRDALRLGAVGFDAVKHLLLCRLEGKPPRLDLELYPHLPRVSVQTTRATDYLTLLSGRAA